MTLTLVLFGLGGVLVGGALSLRSQGVATSVQVLVAVLAALALTGAVLRLLG